MIGAVILTFNSERYIGDCLRSLAEEMVQACGTGRIIVVDNGSTDGTMKRVSEVKEESIHIEVMRLPRNFGTSYSRNVALRKLDAEWIVISDADTIWKKGALSSLLRTMGRDDRIGIAAPRLIYPDGRVQLSAKKFPDGLEKFTRYVRAKYGRERGESFEGLERVYAEGGCVEYCISAAWLVRSKMLWSVGMFDERIFYAPEDADLCLRAWMKGWKVWYEPSAEVVHYVQRLSYSSRKFALLHAVGLAYYFCKHRYIRRRQLLRRVSAIHRVDCR